MDWSVILVADTISVTSVYPTKVDDMTFFCDIDLEHKPLMDKYESLIAQGKYDEAEKLLTNESTILFGYFVKYFNLIENRIETTQSYLRTKGESIKKQNPIVFSDSEPNDITTKTVWI